MKKEYIIQDLLDFLCLSQNQLAEFFNISRSLFTKSAVGTRKFPFRLNERRLEMLNLMARIKAEKAVQAEENPTGVSPSFIQRRLLKVENRIRILNEQMDKMNQKAKARENALEFYDRMKKEFPDLTPLDLAWIQKVTDKISHLIPEDSEKEQKLWDLKILKMELKELNDANPGQKS